MPEDHGGLFGPVVRWLIRQAEVIRFLLIFLRNKEGRILLKQVSKGEITEEFAMKWAQDWIKQNKEILDRFD